MPSTANLEMLLTSDAPTSPHGISSPTLAVRSIDGSYDNFEGDGGGRFTLYEHRLHSDTSVTIPVGELRFQKYVFSF